MLGPEEDEGVSPVRRHKHALRRHGSFKKLTSISGAVNEWFIADERLHQKISQFALRHAYASPSFSSKEGGKAAAGGVGGREMDHAATKVHEEFSEMFEAELEDFLTSKNVSMEQFQEMYKIEASEERRDGTHFYRWMEIVEFEVFLVLMQATASTKSGEAGVKALMQKIESLSAEAKANFRKQSTLRPLLIKWCPADFHAIASVLSATSKTIPHGLDKATTKSLLSWKTKLTSKVMMEGVYQDPPRDEDAWARYLALYTGAMSDDTFSSFIAQVEGHIAAASDAETEESKTRRAVWECFDVCDELHSGNVDLHLLVRYFEKANAFKSEKDKKKLLLKYRAQAREGRKAKPDEHDEPIPVNLEEFDKILRSVFGSSTQQEEGGEDPQDESGFRASVTSLTGLVRDIQ